jgi:undecaprenyl diphosphate synthase
VAGLFKLIERAARDELRVLHQNNVRVLSSGRLDEVPAGLREALAIGAETTKDNTRMVFNLAINYGGRAEIVDAVRKIAADVREGAIEPEAVTEQDIARRLYHPDLPDPDLMIRTGGDLRVSNFLLWQSAYCELHISKSLWPEFKEEAMFDAVLDYQDRTRKFGGLTRG